MTDFSLEGESAFHDPKPQLPWVDLHSSATGGWLARYGGEPFETPFAICAGRAMGAGDLDGDGNVEILVEAWATERTRIYSLGSDVARGTARGVPVGATPDFDGDRVRDVLTLDGIYDPQRWGRIVSGSDGRVLLQWEFPRRVGILRELSGAGDVNGDGCPDVISVHARSPGVLGDLGLDCDLTSGLEGSSIHSWQEGLASLNRVLSAGGLDDLDGDGTREVFMATRDRSGAELSRVRIYSGATCKLVSELTSTAGSFGRCVCSVGDLDGDGIPEILVGDPEYGECAGRVWVYSFRRAGD